MQEVKLFKIEKELENHPKIKNLREFCKKFFELYSADFIILFGSAAKGTYNYRSDLDILIVTDSLSDNYFERLYSMQEITPGAIDFFVYGSTEFKKMVTELHSIALEALATGKIIYDKGNGEKYKKHIDTLIIQNKIQKLENGWKINL